MLKSKRDRRRRRKGQSASSFSKLSSFEPLEVRTLLAASPIGEGFSLGSLGDVSSLDIAPLGSDGSVVTYQADGIAGSLRAGVGDDILVRRFDGDGAAAESILVNQVTRGHQFDPQLATAADGSLLVVWSGRGGGDRVGIFAQRFDAAGSQLGEQFRVNTTRGGAQTQPAVAMAADGSAVVVWQGPGVEDSSGIWLQRIASDGTLAGNETLVNSTTTDMQAYPSTGMAEDGSFVVAWSSRQQDGDGWGIVAQRFDASGVRVGEEFVVNTTTTGSQQKPVVAMASGGNFAIAWSSFEQDGDGWGVFAQRFAADGTRIGDEFQVNEDSDGHQRDVDAVMADGGQLFFSWNHADADGAGWEVDARSYDADGNADGGSLPVNQAETDGQPGHQQNAAVAVSRTGTAFVVYDSGSRANSGKLMAQQFSVDVGPVENVAPRLSDVDDLTANIGELVEVAVTATDANVDDTLTFSLDFGTSPATATIEQTGDRTAIIRWTPTEADRESIRGFRALVDDAEGLSDAVQFRVEVENVVPILDLNGTDLGNGVTVELAAGTNSVALIDDRMTLIDADHDMLQAATLRIRGLLDGPSETLTVTSTANISTSYDAATATLTLIGEATVEEYQAVLKTARYANSLATPTSGQRSVDMTVDDGTASGQGVSEVATATVLVNISGNQDPTLASIPTVSVMAGSPLWVSLNGADMDGDALTFTASSDNPSLISTEIPAGNRSLRIEASDGNTISGAMTFELLEGRVPRVTDQLTTLVEDGFYDGIIFHRVINDFVIQGGDPTGTGSGGSRLGDFDDQFDVDLQHNRTGLLSMAKSEDDTNDSQFFITEGPTRHLDSNHSIFGVLTEGESVRQAISNVATGAGDRPDVDVVMQNVELFNDTENAILLLKAPVDAAADSTFVTVNVADGNGGTTSRTFQVDVVPDTENSPPFLDDIPVLQTTAGTPLTYQLTAQDVESDSVAFLDQDAMDAAGLTVPERAPAGLTYAVDPVSGVLTVTPENGLTGTRRISVAVAASLNGLNFRSPVDFQVVEIQIT